MITDKFDMYCEKYGFADVDDKARLWNSLYRKSGVSINISMYIYNPYTLLLSASEDSALINFSDGILTVCKKDKYNTTIANIPGIGIDRCVAKWYNDTRVEIIMSLGNIVYRIIVQL